ncbi:MAG: hypothetical protein JWN11_1724 [Hyphomicrobiales bacterium]|jgi:hypothetical protein|nr:hypothetical protein [Hyphomicrobiales bacterium]
MTAILLRLLIYVAIAGFIYFGARKIFRDWKNQFRDLDKSRHERDLKERQRPDVIDLKRSSDGVFRPPGDSNERH